MTVKERTDLDERSDTCELSAQELDLVSGGFMLMPIPASLVSALVKKGTGTGGDTGTGGGQNDPAQMFQQIMQQLTQG